MSTPALGARAYWVCQASGWAIYVVISIMQFRSAGFASSRSIIEPLVVVAIGGGATHAFRAFVRPRDWTQLEARALWPRAAAASVVLACLLIGPTALMEAWGFGDAVGVLVVAYALIRWTLVFFTWVALYLGVHLLRAQRESERRRQALETLLKESELRALKAQLNPHFLFNALNSVRALIADDPSGAQTAVTQLARMLRYALGTGRDDFVTLERELEMVDDYLGLEALRLGDRLRVERDIPKGVERARIPVMTLQILVENAVKHGIAELPAGGTLRLSALLANGALEITVENPRPRVPRDDSTPGIGLANATERLRLLAGPAATLRLDLSDAERATASARVPQIA